ncbi:hypothetical protein BRD10_04950 [Halobacteriales archaeon SW_12_71_31]|nr:MAG: hypothetical protein BRD10_04950 [Halobacteriales archaeon SW_12_71_31]
MVDPDSNAGEPFVPSTGNFRGPSSLFADRQGVDDDPDARTTDYLVEWASRATDFAVDALDGERVTLFFDENEPLRDPTRYLAYARYDADGDGERETLYNRQTIEEGYARAYGSTHSRHDEFWAAERAAREAGLGVWTESDVSAASPYREQHAQQDGDGLVYDAPPLFGVDTDAGVALGGGLIVDESYERLEGFDVDTAGFANFAFLSTVIDALAGPDADGPVYIDGGHGQFGVDYALSSEDAAYYQRHLEGRGIGFEQLNDLTLDRLSEARALVVTTPVSALSDAELDAVRSFRDDGGAVVLLGTAAAPDDATDNLNAVADALDSDLRVGDVRVTDPVNNVADDPALVTTDEIDAVSLFGAVFDDGNGEIDFGEVSDVIAEYNADDGNVTFDDVVEIVRQYNATGDWPSL